jgi:two-component system response regulator FixJ
MEQQLIIRFVEPSSRVRAELARSAFALGHHAEVYADLGELIDHMPETGVLVVRADPATGGVTSLMNRLADDGHWFPLIATDVEPSAQRIVAAMKAGALDYLPLPFGRSPVRGFTGAGRQRNDPSWPGAAPDDQSPNPDCQPVYS